MAKNAKKKDEDDDLDMNDSEMSDDDLDLEDPEMLPDEEQPEDDTAYTMGDIVVDDGSSDETDEDERILQSAPTSSSNNDEEEEDVWVDDIDVFANDDPYLEGEDYDPDNADGYYD